MSSIRKFVVALAALAPGALSAAARSARAQRTNAVYGGYDAVRYKTKPLPAQDRFQGKQGMVHVARLDELYVILKPGGKFVAGGRYALDYRPASDRRPLPRPADETMQGTWTRSGGTVTFHPKLSKGRSLPRPLVAVVAGSKMTVDYQVETSAGPRTLQLELVRNPSLLY